jgi:2-oxoglutarate ferredoxin oxidoreductase subunit alpha
MNAGQLRLEIERLCGSDVKVEGLNRIDGQPIDPAQVTQQIRELADK